MKNSCLYKKKPYIFLQDFSIHKFYLYIYITFRALLFILFFYWPCKKNPLIYYLFIMNNHTKNYYTCFILIEELHCCKRNIYVFTNRNNNLNGISKPSD